MKANVEKVAVVTGAYRGIGLEVSRQLARRGFTVVLTARDARKSEEAAAALKLQGLGVVPFAAWARRSHTLTAGPQV